MSTITNETQALLTGALVGHIMIEAGKYRQGDGFMAITDVRPELDDEGNYLSSFIVTFKSGTVLCVSVNEVTTIHEETIHEEP